MPDLNDFSKLEPLLAQLVTGMMKKVPYAAALAIKREGVRATVSSTQSSLAAEPPSVGVVFTAFNGGAFQEFSTNTLEPAALAKAAESLADWTAANLVAGARPLDPGEALRKSWELPLKIDPRKWTPKQRMDHAAELQERLARCGTKVKNATAVVGDLTTEELFVNPVKSLRQRLDRVDEVMQVVVSDGSGTQMLWDGICRGGGYENLGWCAPRARALVADAERLLGAGRLEPGFTTVVTDSEWSGMLAHEAFGHGTETDMYLKDRAKGREYMGKTVASPITNLDDDPTYPGQAATFYFDHEGALARRSAIIEAGILARGMTDSYSAHWLNYERSANGRRESWERKAYARMTNTFFRPGKSSPKEILASVEDGYYLRYPSNGMEDPQGWGIQCEGLWAERIKDGRSTGEIFSPVILTGFVPDILQSISMVGDDLEISGMGYCGKGHKEIVKNTMGGPHLKFRARLA
ncbi:MAG TPA: TldD/PmbA family protein [bacterium]|jgi:TldD protein|nr:TldD/PmbA family protein [bacterium]